MGFWVIGVSFGGDGYVLRHRATSGTSRSPKRRRLRSYVYGEIHNAHVDVTHAATSRRSMCLDQSLYFSSVAKSHRTPSSSNLEMPSLHCLSDIRSRNKDLENTFTWKSRYRERRSSTQYRIHLFICDALTSQYCKEVKLLAESIWIYHLLFSNRIE